MGSLSDMLWIEYRKAVRSRMPVWTGLVCLFMPFGIAFLIYVAKNPEISQQLGLVGAKANLLAYSSTDWETYLGLFGQLIAAGGFFLFILIMSWVFGREFTDGTLKDMLAVPVQRSSILLAKFIVFLTWSVALSVVIIMVGLLIGAFIQLPGGSLEVILHMSIIVMITAGLTMATVMPFAFFASIGRGYLLPLGLAILALMMANLIAVIGYGEYFPWAVPGLFAMGKDPLPPVSYWIVLLTGLAGMIATYLWWKYADQNH